MYYNFFLSKTLAYFLKEKIVSLSQFFFVIIRCCWSLMKQRKEPFRRWESMLLSLHHSTSFFLWQSFYHLDHPSFKIIHACELTELSISLRSLYTCFFTKKNPQTRQFTSFQLKMMSGFRLWKNINHFSFSESCELSVCHIIHGLFQRTFFYKG